MSHEPVSFTPAEWAESLGVSPPGNWPREISGIQADSRRIRPGELFVAIPGHDNDGHRFLEDARKRGAVAVVLEKEEAVPFRLPAVCVPSARRTLARLCRAFYNFPDRNLQLIGITGTNGKTSVTQFVRHIFEETGRPAGSLGTVGVSFGGREIPARRTTPSGPELHKILSDMQRAGCGMAVMEVSSHALDQDRVYGLEFDAAVFTNLSQDHLDYHASMETYFEAKAKLFVSDRPLLRIVGEDAWSNTLAERFGPSVLRCGLGPACQVRAEILETTLAGTLASLQSPWGEEMLRMPLPGLHNVRNALQAIAVACGMGMDLSTVLRATETLEAAPGRLQRIPGGPGRVYVDYAHTPDALANVLGWVKPLARGRVNVVFGCGGDRDRIKRPLMVQTAGKFADEMILTTDNPRHEDPEQIFADMKQGLSPGMSVRIEPDREKAIRLAIEELKDGDVLILAGKGHETIQEVGALQLPFDDREVARRLLAERAAGEGAGGA